MLSLAKLFGSKLKQESSMQEQETEVEEKSVDLHHQVSKQQKQCMREGMGLLKQFYHKYIHKTEFI